MLSPLPKDVLKKVNARGEQGLLGKKKKKLGHGRKRWAVRGRGPGQGRSNPTCGVQVPQQVLHRRYSSTGHRKVPLEGAF